MITFEKTENSAGASKDFQKCFNLIMVCPYLNIVIIWNMIIKINTNQTQNFCEKNCKIFIIPNDLIHLWTIRKMKSFNKNFLVEQSVCMAVYISRTSSRKFIYNNNFEWEGGSKIWKGVGVWTTIVDPWKIAKNCTF